MEVTRNTGIPKTIHHIFCHLLLFGKRNLEKNWNFLKFHVDNLSYIEISTSFKCHLSISAAPQSLEFK